MGLLLIGLAVADPNPVKIVGAMVFMGSLSVFFGKVRHASLGAAGDFTAAELVAIQGLIDSYWQDNTVRKDYEAHVGAALAIRENQTARLAELQNPSKDRTIDVIWVKDCEDRLADCDDDCTVGGAELSAASESYTMDLCKTAGFNVKEKEFRTLALDREEVVAKGILRCSKQLDEWLAQQAITHLNTYAGINQYQDGIFTGAEYNEADAAFWNADLMGEFALISQLNQFRSPFLLSGTNLYKEYWNAQMNAVNANNKDQINKFSDLKMYFDLWNVNSVNTPDKVSYLIDKGSVALLTKSYNPVTPVTYVGAGLVKYKMASKNIPGVEYDIVYTNDCSANEITHKWSLYINGICALNPLGCDADNTGVLKFYCGTPSGS